MTKFTKKIYAFIDASNIIYGCTSQTWKMDFKKLIKYLKTRYSCQKIFYYAGLDQENKKQLKFYEKLAEFGYILKLVPIKRFKERKSVKIISFSNRTAQELKKLVGEEFTDLSRIKECLCLNKMR